jgi:DNA-binding transcriptional regulator YiaG
MPTRTKIRGMPNIATALKVEISRLARKEVKQETDALKKASAQYRHQIAALRKQVDTLERQLKRVAKPKPVDIEEHVHSDTNLRFRPAGFAQHRRRLGLSAREMALLLDASALSVYKWETGQARPRAKHLEAIASVRKLGKRAAAKRLEELIAS